MDFEIIYERKFCRISKKFCFQCIASCQFEFVTIYDGKIFENKNQFNALRFHGKWRNSRNFWIKDIGNIVNYNYSVGPCILLLYYEI